MNISHLCEILKGYIILLTEHEDYHFDRLCVFQFVYVHD